MSSTPPNNGGNDNNSHNNSNIKMEPLSPISAFLRDAVARLPAKYRPKTDPLLHAQPQPQPQPQLQQQQQPPPAPDPNEPQELGPSPLTYDVLPSLSNPPFPPFTHPHPHPQPRPQPPPNFSPSHFPPPPHPSFQTDPPDNPTPFPPFGAPTPPQPLTRQQTLILSSFKRRLIHNLRSSVPFAILARYLSLPPSMLRILRCAVALLECREAEVHEQWVRKACREACFEVLGYPFDEETMEEKLDVELKEVWEAMRGSGRFADFQDRRGFEGDGGWRGWRRGSLSGGGGSRGG